MSEKRRSTLTRDHLALTMAALGSMLFLLFFWGFLGLMFGQSLQSMKAALIPIGPLSSMPSAEAGIFVFLWGMVEACIMAPVLEEMFWRWTFCSIAYDDAGQPRANWSLPVVVMSGLLFAVSHGFKYGFTNEMVIQLAPAGLILSGLWILLRRHGASWLIALGCCAFAHGSYNFGVGTLRKAIDDTHDAAYKDGYDKAAGQCQEARDLVNECINVLGQLVQTPDGNEQPASP